MKMGELFQSGDWKNEKHVPAIDCPDTVKADESFDITVSIGKEIGHPNTTEHHIRWIRVYFKPEDDKFAYDVGSYEFNAHGESVQGANQGPVYTDPKVTARMKVNKPGTVVASIYCNIHGLWENTAEVKVS
ncbi:MAG: class II SORL domain-containing protein [Desulfobacterales bacterium]|nr:class II SORL domain-containing protein [Desulfobacterales bacterium]MBS3755119.1 class II SORL domain-containing protein [Desulfobacterales bacterium]